MMKRIIMTFCHKVKIAIAVFLSAILLTYGLYFTMHSVTKNLDVHADAVVQRLDSKIGTVLTELDSIEVDTTCSEEQVVSFENATYRSENTRALGVVYTQSEVMKACSLFGGIDLLEPEKLWHQSSMGNIAIGTSLQTTYFPERSFFVGRHTGTMTMFGYVNPRYILGKWIQPEKQDAYYAFFLNTKADAPLYQTHSKNKLDRNNWLDNLYGHVSYSEKYPYHISVSIPYSSLIKSVSLSLLKCAVVILITIMMFFAMLALLRDLAVTSNRAGHRSFSSLANDDE